MQPLVSVIVPAYNHAAFVGDAIGSVLSQSVDNFEIIAIDDASQDDTAEVLAAFDDPRLTLRRHEQNRGAAQTLNEGIALARGEYLAILNSDDRYQPTRLAECLDTLRQRDLLLLGTHLALINAYGVPIQDPAFWWNQWYQGLIRLYRSSHDLGTTLITGNLFISTSNFVLHRSLVERVGLFSDLRYVHDYDYLMRCLIRVPEAVAWIDRPLLQYRLHERNTILEDAIPPVRQTIGLLARHAPDLIQGAHQFSRRDAFEEHLLRMAGYIERDSAVHATTQCREIEAAMQNCITAMEANYEDLQAHCRRLQAHCDLLEAKLNVAPLRWLRYLARQARAIVKGGS
jgi:glycosyltransferase involved in cell wall biosynthesis